MILGFFCQGKHSRDHGRWRVAAMDCLSPSPVDAISTKTTYSLTVVLCSEPCNTLPRQDAKPSSRHVQTTSDSLFCRVVRCGGVWCVYYLLRFKREMREPSYSLLITCCQQVGLDPLLVIYIIVRFTVLECIFRIASSVSTLAHASARPATFTI